METKVKLMSNLFEEWKSRMSEGSTNFNKDGVFYRRYKKEEERYNAWDSAEVKVLFLAKEARDKNIDVAASWSNSNFHVNKYTKCQYLYLTYICDNQPEFETIDISADAIKAKFEKTPFCWINVKKSMGEAHSCLPELANEIIDVSGDLLLKEIEILRPTHIICLCGWVNYLIKMELRCLSYKPMLYTALHPAYVTTNEKKYNSLTPM